MRIRLDDNERGAFNYLIGGVAIVLTIRGLAWVAGAMGPASTEDGAVLQVFQRGYLGMHNQLAVADASMGLTGRIILALVMAVGASFATALLLTFAGHLREGRSFRAGSMVTRMVLLAFLGWGVFTACYVPISESRVINGTLVVYTRNRLLGDIPLPFFIHRERWQREDIGQIVAEETPPTTGCNGSVALLVHLNGKGRPQRIAGIDDTCPEQRMVQLRKASGAAALMERELR
ncbi:MAG: hypothetical protein JST38_13970 [Bacteroidetes bacterium]|nr:hypothetical protein [Bacteroidota bacterium]MBS1941975.1 hypothetical protein [Bacteroidota bacterium]